MSVMRTITQRQTQTAGMALGGLGTGSVEIYPDGRLGDFHIFNLGKWATVHPERYGMEDLPGYQEGDILPFYVRVKEEGRLPVVRKLSHNSPSGGFRSLMYSWMKEVEEISWTPEFPVCHLGYQDSVLPIELRADFTAPFLPHDSCTSGTPGFYASFHLTNPTDHPIEVSLLGTLKNPVNRGLCDRQLQNTVLQEPSRTTLTMASTSPEGCCQNGSLSLSVSGGSHTYIQGDFETFFGAHVQGGSFGATEESCLFDFRENGELPNSGWEHLDSELLALTESEIAALDERQLEDAVRRLTSMPSAMRPMRRIREVSDTLLDHPEERRRFLGMVLNCYRRLGEEFADCQWGSGALCGKVVLQPGESQTIRFVLGWYFPHHFSNRNRFVGHQYTNWFADSGEVNRFLCENAGQLLEKAETFSKLLLSSDMHASFIRSWSVQLSTLVKCSWWSKEGRFGIWEGYGSCGFHTTDIAYYGSFGLLALFPELELGQMEMTAAFQREDGRIPHFFVPDFDRVDDGFDRVDMNPQFVLLVCRDYLWTGNRVYLSQMWNAIVRAMESAEQMDGDGDGLPDQDTRANTYDAWRFQGTPAYIAGLWLAALTAGVRIASDLGETACRDHWQELLDKGRESYIKKLWNGSYFSLWVDGAQRDECCMSGQLDGIWYARLLGLPAILDEAHISKAVQAILANNFHPETGLINASYPAGAQPTLYTHHNVQADANWSGVEFGFASFLLELNRLQEAEALTRAVEERHYYAGRIFNHEECGEYYYRALSSWTLLLSLSGWKLDEPTKCLTISPVMGKGTIPWFTPTGYGSLTWKTRRLVLSCMDGEICFRELRLRLDSEYKQAKRQDAVLEVELLPYGEDSEGVRMRFSEECHLSAGTVLTIY